MKLIKLPDPGYEIACDTYTYYNSAAYRLLYRKMITVFNNVWRI
jgi:hypothetical protein